ncbi:hypothetical protein Ddye_017101 [Dipteronia dyeriana]|uniref:Myb/SANT-like domain-containing protein n=1 Tax=Dipteronia dyeriana TaxID=168575 RepID=A0AAD9U826_9ROSI|nr:hypothetical protein Ddye_017101 [Dipteronia dyeriana]
MDRNAFAMLCELLKTRGGLLDDGNVTIEEQVATFVNILAHHTKNRSVQVRFYRSGETISRHVHRVLRALLRLSNVLFVKPTLVPYDCTDSKWRWFKGCLGALDGTYIEVIVPESDKPRRNWTPEEEDVMITILEGIVVDGGRCDTGSFRPGTYELVASKMREKIENITITGKHVQNKMKRLKDKYSAAYDMLNTSGFCWNDTHKCVPISPEILEEYSKKHPNKNYTSNRPFPHYEQLVTVFGKNQATRNMVESAADALDNMGLETEESDTAGFTQPSTTPSNVVSASSNPNTGETSKRKRKRNVNSTTEEITKVFEKNMERASVDIAKLTEAITGGNAMTRLGVELEGS